MIGKATQVFTLCALFGAFGVFTLCPEPEPQPEPPIFADNRHPDIPPPICTQECSWVGDVWTCVTICL